jgi:membrane-bound lytic murein transglycosylase B
MVSRHGFERAELDRAFGLARSQPQILELMNRAAEPRPWEDYRSIFVTGEKIAEGARFWSENAEVLALAKERFGVPEETIIAVIGIETHYGRNRGKYKVLEALSTLAFEYPRRADEFRLELEHFLLLSREESLPLDAPLGSYAGAMGIAQFLPGSYRRYAVDFDGDGKRDLFANTKDAIGSVANYLTAHGWQRNGPVAVPARVSPSGVEPFLSGKLSTRYLLSELHSIGIETEAEEPSTRAEGEVPAAVGSELASGGEPPSEERGGTETREALGVEPRRGHIDADSTSAIPLTLKTRNGPEYWLGFENFYVITRYNQSVYYAMAVYQLGEEIRKDHSRTDLGLDASHP